MYIADSCRTQQTIKIVQFVTLGSLTNPDDDGIEKVTKKKKLVVLLNCVYLAFLKLRNIGEFPRS